MMVTSRFQVLASAIFVGWVAASTPTQFLAGQAPRTVSVTAALQDSDGDRIPDRLGQHVTLRGVLISNPVVIGSRASRVNLQDSTGGLRLLTPDTALLAGRFREGDVVLVRGTVGQYRGMEELLVEDIRRLGVGPLPRPRDVLVADLSRERYQGQLVRLAGELRFGSDSAARQATTVLRDRSGDVPVVIPSRFFADRRFADRLPKGGSVVLTGIAEQRDDSPPFDSGYRVRPRAAGDFVFAPIPPYRAITLTVILLLLVGATVYLWVRRRRAERRGTEMAELAQNLEQARKGLEASLSLLQATLDSTADGILVVDRAGKVVSHNRKFVAMWSIPETLVTAGADDLLLSFVLDQAKDGAAFLRRVNELYAQPEAEGTDILEFKDGRVVERHSRPQYLGREVVGRVWSFRDVTKRTRAETALRQSEAHFRSLVENAPYGIYRSTTDGRLLAVNPALVKLLGYGSEDELLVADLATQIYHDPAERDRLIAEQGQRPWIQEVEARWKRKDGSPVRVRLSGRTVVNERGQMDGFEGFVEDVTAKELLEQQLRQAQKMEAVGRLAGGVAHDFNNLLTVILGSADMLLSELGSNDPHGAEASAIKRAATRAAALTHQLLAFSRRQALAPKVLDVNVVVADAAKLLRRLIGEDIELATISRAGAGRVRVDPSQLEQVLMNLVVNARDAMPEGGNITIETDVVELDSQYASTRPAVVPGRYVMVAVSDTGVGMDRETQTHLFEPFFTTKELGKGTGLGLATVYGIVKQSGGYIWVYSEPGQGATFKIYLPVVAEPAAAPTEDERVPSRLDGSETILLVEDEETVRALALRVLARRGYTLLEAADGEEALRKASEHLGPIHLLMTDVIMPRMTGRELARHLTEARAELKVLYASGYTDDAVFRHGVLEPGTAFLQKPFTPDALARTVREVIDGPVRASAESGVPATAA